MSFEPEYSETYIYEPSGKQGDDGIDLVLFLKNNGNDNTIKFDLVQCKNWENPVGIKDVQRTSALLNEYVGIRKAIVMSMGGFTESSKNTLERVEEINPGRLELWNRQDIKKMITKHSLNIDLNKPISEINVYLPTYLQIKRGKDRIQ